MSYNSGGIDYAMVQRAHVTENYARLDADDSGPSDAPRPTIEPVPDPETTKPTAGRQESSQPLTYTVAELAAFESADEAYIVGEGILTKGGKLLIHGSSGVGKTTLAHDLAGCLATGRQWLGRYAIDEPHDVLCVQGELSLPEMASHAQQLVSAGYDVDGLRFARMTGLRLPEGEDELRDLIRAAGARVVVLDPWYRLFTGESSNQPEQVDRVFQVADRLLEDDTADAIVVVHHSNVNGMRTAGSWVFEGWPSTIMQVEPVEGVPDQRIDQRAEGARPRLDAQRRPSALTPRRERLSPGHGRMGARQ